MEHWIISQFQWANIVNKQGYWMNLRESEKILHKILQEHTLQYGKCHSNIFTFTSAEGNSLLFFTFPRDQNILKLYPEILFLPLPFAQLHQYK